MMNMKRIQLTWFVAFLVVLVTTGAIFFVQKRFGSFASAMKYMQGARTIIENPIRSIGFVKERETIKITYKITNLSNTPTMIVGSNSSCTCTVVTNIPVTIEPRSTHEIEILFKVPQKRGAISNEVKLFTTDPKMKEARLKVLANVY